MAKNNNNNQEPARKFKSVSNAVPFHVFKNEGESIEGYFRSVSEIKSKFNNEMQKKYVISTTSGDKALSGTGLLNYLMKDVPVGSYIKVVFKGKKEIKNPAGKKVNAKQWDVLIDENETPVDVD